MTRIESSVFIYFSVTLLLILASKKHQCEAGEWRTSLTTLNLEDQFKEKCKTFGTIKRSSQIYKTELFNDKGCEDLWKHFIAVIENKDKSTVQQGYADYFKYIERKFYKDDFEDSYFNEKVDKEHFQFFLKYPKYHN